MSFNFGDMVTNLCAGDGNPTRTGIFVRRGFNSGRLNHGPWIECTNGQGKFWKTTERFLVRAVEVNTICGTLLRDASNLPYTFCREPKGHDGNCVPSRRE